MALPREGPRLVLAALLSCLAAQSPRMALSSSVRRQRAGRRLRASRQRRRSLPCTEKKEKEKRKK